jgi:hypothetical protein
MNPWFAEDVFGERQETQHGAGSTRPQARPSQTDGTTRHRTQVLRAELGGIGAAVGMTCISVALRVYQPTRTSNPKTIVRLPTTMTAIWSRRVGCDPDVTGVDSGIIGRLRLFPRIQPSFSALQVMSHQHLETLASLMPPAVSGTGSALLFARNRVPLRKHIDLAWCQGYQPAYHLVG